MVYRIKDWNLHYSNNRSREIMRPTWCSIPNKQDGGGYRRLLRCECGEAAYGCFVAAVLACSKHETRDGWLTDDGRPSGRAWDADDISLKTGFSLQTVEKMLAYTTLPTIGWVEEVEQPQEGATVPHLPAASSHKGASSRARAGQDRTGREWTGRDTYRSGGVGGTDCLPDLRVKKLLSSDHGTPSAEKLKVAMGNPQVNPVQVALELVGEEGDNRMRGFLANARLAMGEIAFRQEVVAFGAELASGEDVRNRGAALVARLKVLIAHGGNNMLTVSGGRKGPNA